MTDLIPWAVFLLVVALAARVLWLTVRWARRSPIDILNDDLARQRARRQR